MSNKKDSLHKVVGEITIAIIVLGLIFFILVSLAVSWVFLYQLGWHNWWRANIPPEKRGMTFRLYPDTNNLSSYIDYHQARITVVNTMPTRIESID